MDNFDLCYDFIERYEMSRIPLVINKKNERSCEGCTRCCEGWLGANINGHEMYPGKPCFFVEQGVGCKIYVDRPEDPCKTFQCMWRADDRVPIEFKPSDIGSLITTQQINGIEYLALVECGETMRPEVVSWFMLHAVSNKINAEWKVNGKSFWIGMPDFSAAMENREVDIKIRQKELEREAKKQAKKASTE